MLFIFNPPCVLEYLQMLGLSRGQNNISTSLLDSNNFTHHRYNRFVQLIYFRLLIKPVQELWSEVGED